MNTLILLIIALFIVGLVVVAQYNRLIRLRNSYRNEFSVIDLQLRRRHDLIPNLVETAKAYMAHERQTLEAVVQARQNAIASQGNLRERAQLESGLTQALGKFMALAEAYPELKANQNMIQLSEELSRTEDKIAGARQVYNTAVTNYNTAIESFPVNFIANSLNFKVANLFEIEDQSHRNHPQVSFG